MNEISTDLSDWYTTESEADVTRSEVLDDFTGRANAEAAFLEACAGSTDSDNEVCLRMYRPGCESLAAMLRAAIALLEAEPREPDGWVRARWKEVFADFDSQFVYDRCRKPDDVPVYIGAQPEVGK